jgi:diguanylate cyclase (GGDEF)-like protein
MSGRIIDDRKSLRLILGVSLAASIFPAALSGFELYRIRADVVAVQNAAREASHARDLVDRVSQSLFNLAAAPLNLSTDERAALTTQTDANLKALTAAVSSAKGLTGSLLSATQEADLSTAIEEFSHSWEEIKAGLAEGMEEGEKAYHFLNIFNEAAKARDLLMALQTSATTKVDQSSAASIAGISEVGLMLALVFALAGVVSTAALIANHRIAGSLRRTNDELEGAVSELNIRDRELQDQNSRFNAAIENMSQGLSMFDGAAQLIVCNRRFGEIYGLQDHLLQRGATLSAILARMADNGFHVAEGVGFADLLQRGLTSEEAFAANVRAADDRVVQIVGQPMADGGFVATHEDVTERKLAEARIAHMAHHDALTGLPNRLLYREKLEDALACTAQGDHFQVLCIDLDHFKDVNDALGHPVGDKLLQQVSARLRKEIGPHDTVARLGGDEFAIIQLGAELRESSDLAHRLIETLSMPYEIDDHQVIIGCSVGIALAPQDGTDPVALLKAADLALYRAKTNGRGAFQFYEAEMDARLQARRVLELDLRNALANDELEVFYQPQINLDRNNISGFEALLRWNHPERGTVSPAIFIPVAEEIGLIGRIGAWVLKAACCEAIKWPHDIKVAVNLSPAQFKNRSLILDVTSALAVSGLRASRLELEITESVMLQDTDSVLTTLHQIHDLGVRISMDDFGTGYSSLSYLRKFPFDKIKIDQSFVRDVCESGDTAAIVKAVATMSASLGMDTTAEGVETLEQLQRVRLEGCTEVQGYFYSKPLPGGKIPELISSLLGNERARAVS